MDNQQMNFGENQNGMSSGVQEGVNKTENLDNLKEEKKNIYILLEEEITALNIPDSEKVKRLSRLIKVRNQKVNIMLTGATGAGKSSTINALFNMEIAKVGVGVDPETENIEKFELDNLTIWDTPGLGDGMENDERIRRAIINKLNELDAEGNPLIDLVVVILDSSSKDLGTSYELINDILIPCLGSDAKDRILIALNQADIAMKGTHWDEEMNEPDEVLKDFLRKKAKSVQNRIGEATGLNIKPIYYCAGYMEEGEEQRKPYNLTKLLYYIIKAIPKEKRLALVDNINEGEDNWIYDDNEDDYKQSIKKGFGETIWDCITDGADDGAYIGSSLLGIPGKLIGATVGAAVGAVKGVFSAILAR